MELGRTPSEPTVIELDDTERAAAVDITRATGQPVLVVQIDVDPPEPEWELEL